MKTPPQIELARELSEQLTLHKNIGQEIVLTTVDKVRLCLMETRDCLRDQREWVTPLALGVSLGGTLVAAEFHDFILGKAVWQASYTLALLACVCWFVFSLDKARRNRDRGSIDYIVNRLKSDTTRALGGRASGQELVINTATYTAGSKGLDVTEALSRRIDQGRLEVVASNDLGGDPHFGIVKELVVEYTYRGERLKKSVREGDMLSLP